MSTNHPNWVAERAKCYMGFLFDDLSQLVKADVDRMNTEQERRSLDGRFTYIPYANTQPRFELEWTDTTGNKMGRCRFEYQPDRDVITVLSLAGDCSIRTCWDAEQGQCQIKVEPLSEQRDIAEFPHDELWRAVQYVLEPFFFPPKGQASG